MRYRLFICTIVLIQLFSGAAFTQVIERERPAEWSKLVYGGRFMNRFKPIPTMGSLTSETWGAENVIPRYTENGIDVLKHEDKRSDRHSSKHICIPLTVGRQITILNREKIDATTATIRIRIAAEEGFNPHTDMDLSTLRFGAPEAVNFGGGAGLMETDASGNDLILTFKGEDNGFTDDNFAAKLLGRDAKGNLLFGYARLPWLDYGETGPTTRNVYDTIHVSDFGAIADSRQNATLAVKHA